ncbi:MULTISPECIES: protein kinase family protein [unclassified Nocardioides]|uniref:protein kinase family protein n=1 Tax=unclassified Nocardioides TaxID=2615069 RepID=UPI00071543E0|nr:MULTISPECIES: protein kinase family protein [unclassified Nocardioides]KRC68084.1 hypothetical protein ASE20_18805 [Nocardioides sp. Root240]
MATSTRSGDVLAGRYRLIDLLSESGGGRFWRAHDAVLERFVALHVIAEDDPRAPGLVAAARTSAGVLDPRILRVLDAEQEDGRCFVVNEWGTGTSLDILVTHAGPLGPRRAAWLVADVAAAIARAHAAGVTHGRLNPENVLIDRYGSVRLIGMCVDAALHGLPAGDVQGDLEDLGGLLYCALTGVWPGPSGSIVPAAPRENGAFLSPRQVRAGVPNQLDLLWREFECTGVHVRRRMLGSEHPDVSSARGIAEELLAFVGDPTGMPESLAQAIPQVNELRPVWLPAVADPLPHDSSRDDIPVVPPAVEADIDLDRVDLSDPPVVPAAGTGVTDLPTEPGLPVFGAGEDDVQWLRTRSTPPPPPPPFEALPERPLFASEGTRRPRPDLGPGPAGNGWPAALPDDAGAGGTGYWPWDTDGGPPGAHDPDTTDDAVPGRSWLRLAMAVALAVLLLVAIAIAFNLGRGRNALGGGGSEEEPSVAPSSSAGQPAVIKTVTAKDFDPLGQDGEENSGDVRYLTDGKAGTRWRTSTYRDQLGPPPGLKTGVGILLDLGSVQQVSSVDVRLGEGQTTIELYAATETPTAAPTGKPVARTTGSGPVTLAPADGQAVGARYLVLWLTSLPEVDDGDFRGEMAEVVVRGGAA